MAETAIVPEEHIWFEDVTQSPGDAGLVYCLDYLDSNLDWLQEKLALVQKGITAQPAT